MAANSVPREIQCELREYVHFSKVRVARTRPHTPAHARTH